MAPDNRQFLQFLAEVRARFGLVFEPSRHDELRSLLQERTTYLRYSGIAEYLAWLKTAESEWQDIANRLTVPETYFFRIPGHFDAFANQALPSRITVQKSTKSLRLASVGCASGEEPYSMAMILRAHFPELADWRVEITALDVSRNALARARRGLYSNWSLRGTPDSTRERFFRNTKAGWELDPEIKKMVRFGERNIIGMCDEQIAPYDIVFFRNVLIYFSPESMRAAVACVADMMLPGGYLFLGTAETLRGISNEFSLLHSDGAFYYTRVDDERQVNRRVRREVERFAAPELSRALPDQVRPITLPTPPNSPWAQDIRQSNERISRLTSGKRAVPRKAAKKAREAALASAMAMFAAEKYAEAISELDALTAEEGAVADVHVLRAVLLTNVGQVDEAERSAKLALDLDHLHAGAFYILALCSEQKGDISGALQHDAMAAYLDPAFAMPHLHAATLHRRRGERDAACADLENARTRLAGEDTGRILLFGGGFTREALIQYCERQMINCRSTQ